MKHRTLQIVSAALLLFGIMFVFLHCSSDKSNLRDAAGALADRCADSLGFEDVDQVEEETGEPPQTESAALMIENTGNDSRFIQPEVVYSVAFEAAHEEEALTKINRTVLYVDKDGSRASKYFKIWHHFDESKGKIIFGFRLKDDPELYNQSFNFNFALMNDEGVVGAYHAVPLTVVTSLDGDEDDEGETCDPSTCAPSASAKQLNEDENGISWTSIPAGCLCMGCSPNDTECEASEYPIHEVEITPFEMMTYEATQAQFETVMGYSPSGNMPEEQPCEGCPVWQLTKTEARDFCTAIGAGLPSEAEWEYAARAGAYTKFYCGDDAACLDANAWYFDNSENPEIGSQDTHPPGEKQANGFGLFDIHGNVREWVEDCWHDNYESAPDNDEAWLDGGGFLCPKGGILRGGGFFDTPAIMRLSYRFKVEDPESEEIETYDFGVRCVRAPVSE